MVDNLPLTIFHRQLTFQRRRRKKKKKKAVKTNNIIGAKR